MQVLTYIGAAIAGIVVAILWFLVLLLVLGAVVYVVAWIIDALSGIGGSADSTGTAGP
jgi:hypothetical protein